MRTPRMPSNRYTIRFAPTANRNFDRLPAQIRWRVRAAIDRLAFNPRPPGVRKLSGNAADYRIRVSRYRVLYDINGDEVLVYIVRIGYRREIHRNS